MKYSQEHQCPVCAEQPLRFEDKGKMGENVEAGQGWRKTGVPGNKAALCICTGTKTRVKNHRADVESCNM